MQVTTTPQLQIALTSLHARKAEVKMELGQVRDQAQQRRTALASALTRLANTCAAVDQRAVHANAQLLKRVDGLQTLLRRADAFAPEQALRLKSTGTQTRLVKLESRSFLKQLLGIGAARRKQEVSALAGHLGVSSTVIRREHILHANNAVADAVLRNVDEGIKGALPAIRHALSDAAAVAGVGDDVVEALVSPLTNAVLLEESAAEPQAVLKKALQDAINADVAPFRQELATLDDEIKSVHRQIADERRAALAQARLSGLKQRNVAVPKATAAALEELLDTKVEETEFRSIYNTDSGCAAIQSMLEGTGTWVDPSAVFEDIRKINGDDTFTHGAAEDKRQLKVAMKLLTVDKVKEIDRLVYQTGLAHFAEGGAIVTSFRRAGHSVGMINELKSLVETGQLISPTRLMSTAPTRDGTEIFPRKLRDGAHLVEFEIAGFSSARTASQWGGYNERGERFFSTHSCFAVRSVDKQPNGVWKVRLLEQPVNNGYANATALRF